MIARPKIGRNERTRAERETSRPFFPPGRARDGAQDLLRAGAQRRLAELAGELAELRALAVLHDEHEPRLFPERLAEVDDRRVVDGPEHVDLVAELGDAALRAPPGEVDELAHEEVRRRDVLQFATAR